MEQMWPQTNTTLVLTQDSKDCTLKKLQLLNNPSEDT